MISIVEELKKSGKKTFTIYKRSHIGDLTSLLNIKLLKIKPSLNCFLIVYSVAKPCILNSPLKGYLLLLLLNLS
jgi:hypothetical protein